MGRNTVATGSTNWNDYKPKQELNSFYRTTDVLNGVFKKKIKFEKGPMNCTDLKTIWVNLNEIRFRSIARVEQPRDGKYLYTLSCGHPWESKNSHAVDKYVPCWTCGTDESYKGFEHEWEHIIFKSNLPARAIFVDQYVQMLQTQVPNISPERLKSFLHLLVNAFDDIRVNSLQEKVYPGSAWKIWERWRRLLSEGDDYNQNFLAFVLAVGLGLDVDPNGPFYSLFPIVQWGMAKARYRGFGRMLLDVRIVLDRCMATLLALNPPQPQPQQGHEQQEQQEPGDSVGDQSGGAGQSGPPQADPNDGAEQRDDENGKGGAEQSANGNAVPPDPSASPTTAEDPKDSKDNKERVLSKLIDGAEPLDPQESHYLPSKEEIDQDPSSVSNRMLVKQILDQDINNLAAIDQDQSSDTPDPDMQQAIDLLKNAIPEKSTDSRLMDDARAKIVFIDVEPYHIDETSFVTLAEEEEISVDRLRALFYRELGRKKAFRDITGPAVDIPAFIQFKIDRKNPDIYEGETLNRGFAYHVVSDMSGSMSTLFPKVAHSMVMLQKALDFPFVSGSFWGFRGGEDIWFDKVKNKYQAGGEVWLYRYHKRCKGFLGKAPLRFENKVKQVPVACGGLTPMHSALRVASRHVARNVPSGMAKRIFLLTDGSPFHAKSGGGLLNESMLKAFVAKEVQWARSHGIDVYVVVIGPGITDEEALQMFGNRKFWKRAGSSGEDSVDKVLTGLVMANFSKYLRVR